MSCIKDIGCLDDTCIALTWWGVRCTSARLPDVALCVRHYGNESDSANGTIHCPRFQFALKSDGSRAERQTNYYGIKNIMLSIIDKYELSLDQFVQFDADLDTDDVAHTKCRCGRDYTCEHAPTGFEVLAPDTQIKQLMLCKKKVKHRKKIK